ncbi:MAG: hypothetical protein Q9191_006505 [Dirinaria sp. TL-2023a]
MSPTVVPASQSKAAPYWVQQLHHVPRASSKASTLPDPPGYTTAKRSSSRSAKQTSNSNLTPSAKETDTLKIKKAWEIALAPAKALPMNAIMMYMSGNSLQIFSIMMVFMLFKNPVQSLMQTNQAFTRFETEGTRQTLWLIKAAYVAMNLVALALGVWKVNGMGLLP